MLLPVRTCIMRFRWSSFDSKGDLIVLYDELNNYSTIFFNHHGKTAHKAANCMVVLEIGVAFGELSLYTISNITQNPQELQRYNCARAMGSLYPRPREKKK